MCYFETCPLLSPHKMRSDRILCRVKFSFYRSKNALYYFNILFVWFMQNPASIDYCNVISNLLQSNMGGNKKIHNGIHSSGIFPEKSPNAEFLEANNTG